MVCQRSVVTGTELQCADTPERLHGHTAAVRAVAWSLDGRYLATGGDDAQVIVWDCAANFAQVLKIPQDAPVNAMQKCEISGLSGSLRENGCANVVNMITSTKQRIWTVPPA